MQGVMERTDLIGQLQKQMQKASETIKQMQGDLQTREREIYHAKMKAEVEKTKSDLKAASNKAKMSGTLFEKRLDDALGQVKKERIAVKNKEGDVIRTYDQFERVNNEVCQYTNWDNLASKYCYKCKKTFPITTTGCPTCVYTKGKAKGQQVNLKQRKSKVHFCQLGRKDYKKEGANEEEQNS